MRSVEQVYIRMCIDMYIPMYMRRRACVRSGLMYMGMCMYCTCTYLREERPHAADTCTCTAHVLHMYMPMYMHMHIPA